MIGIVKESSQTESGAPFITIDRQRYYFGREVAEYPKVGARIKFEFNEFGEAKGKFGKPRSISRWEPVVDSQGKPETGSTISDADILRSVSNVVGSACAAGTVKSPDELAKWFLAAFVGFTRRAKSAAPADPDFDDDLDAAFYRDPNNQPDERF